MSDGRHPEIWWERWNGRYKPVHWKGWASLAGLVFAIPTVMFSARKVMAFLGRPDDRLASVICVITVVVFFAWFVERHTPKARQ